MTLAKILTQISKQLTPKIDNAMTREVFEEVRDEEVATISDEVYKVYTPQMYLRRGEYGGLADPHHIVIQGGAARGGRMIVVNTTGPNPGGCVSNARVTTGKNLPELIEYGNGYKFYSYDFLGVGRYMGPRPFTEKTIEHLKTSRAHVTALKDGLMRQGISAKCRMYMKIKD